MADMRDRLIDLLANKARCPENVKNCGECPCFDKEYFVNCNEDAATADMLLANGVILQEWISVDDRLPENDVMVIGYTPCDGFMFVGYYHEEPKYDRKVWRIITAMRSTKVMKKKVTHWLPLPKPPKAEKALREKDE